uniref:glucuronosyltransferase n=1 Tax=Strongyloides papillosus TaxID=174720 RepID=A0A0N5BUV4_STREA
MDPGVKHPGAYKAKVISYTATKEIEDSFGSGSKNKFLWNLSNNGPEQYKMFFKLIDAAHAQLMRVFNDDELTERIKKEKFDLGIVEAFHFSIIGKFKAWGINAYVTGISMSLEDSMYKFFGMPFPGSFIPNHMSPFSDKMTYKERFQNILAHYVGEIVYYLIGDKLTLQKDFNNKYGKGFYDSKAVVGDSSFLILNSNPFLDVPGPKTPKMVEVSGIGIKDTKPLNEYWNKILSLRNKTVLVSFGTFTKAEIKPF